MTATDELRTLLTTTWQPATAVQRRMEEAGFTVDEARTAKRRLGVSRDLGTVPFIGRKWNWRPPASCVACGRPWRPDGCRGLDHWADGPSTPASHEEKGGLSPMDEPSVPLSPEPPRDSWRLVAVEPAVKGAGAVSV
jgi:hypothetical protein